MIFTYLLIILKISYKGTIKRVENQIIFEFSRAQVVTVLSMSLYGMFLAIIIPPAQIPPGAFPRCGHLLYHRLFHQHLATLMDIDTLSCGFATQTGS